MIVVDHPRTLRELTRLAWCRVAGHRWGGAHLNSADGLRMRDCQRRCGATHIERWRPFAHRGVAFVRCYCGKAEWPGSNVVIEGPMATVTKLGLDGHPDPWGVPVGTGPTTLTVRDLDGNVVHRCDSTMGPPCVAT